MSLTQLLLLFSGLIFINACSQSTIQSSFVEYQQQLSDQLNQKIELDGMNNTLNYPSPQSMKLEIPEITINLRDIYALKHCSVSTLIAQRNTALGKVQLPSIRFTYEVQLIQGLTECLQITDNAHQRQQLTEWISQKRKALPNVWADMIHNSSEIRRTFSGDSRLFTQIDEQTLMSYQQSLNYLIALYSPINSDLSLLEQTLNDLRKQPLSAQIWRTQKQLRLWLMTLTSALQNASIDLSCQTAQSKQHVNNLKAIFQRNFTNEIQPVVRNLQNVHRRLEPNFQKLYENPVLVAAFKEFLKQRKLEYQRYRIALQNHQGLWQEIFNQCELPA